MSLVKCELCYKECRLSDGQRGDCRVRVNSGGKLISLVYGNPCAVHVDPIEKKPLFHMIPSSRAFSIATAGCNLHCKFCQNWSISQRGPEETDNYDLPPEEVVKSAIANRCRSIAYTYSEPTVFYEYVLDTAQIAQRQGIKNIMVTAGYIQDDPLRELALYIDAANIDLKGFREKYYREICSAELAGVLRAIRLYKKLGIFIELTNLIVPTLNDDMDIILEMCMWIRDELGADTPLHFSRFTPMYKLAHLPPTPTETLTRAREVALNAGLEYVYIGNVPGHPGENTYCPGCGKLLIGRTGYFVTTNNVAGGSCKFCGKKISGIWEG